MKTLYHYCSSSSFLSIIEKKSIRLSSLTLSNDSQEGKILINTINNLFEKDNLDKEIYDQITKSLKMLEQFFDGLGFCLSEFGDILSQWRGYANDGRGFSIGFSKKYIELLMKNLPLDKPKFILSKVIYDKLEQQSAVEPLYNKIKSVIESGKLYYPKEQGLLSLKTDDDIQKELNEYESAFRDLLSNTIIKGLPNLFSLKNKAFIEEREWRLISYLLKDIHTDCSYYSNMNAIVPYRTFKLIALDVEPISEIFIGPKNITPNFVVDGLLKKNGYNDVRISRSKATYR